MYSFGFNKMSRAKKAQAASIFAAIVFLVAFGFLSIIGFFMHGEIVDAFNETGFLNNSVAIDTAEKNQAALGLFDDIIIVIAVVLIIALGLANFKLRTSPAFFIIAIIESVVIAFGSFIFNYIFLQLVGQSIFTATIVFFPKTMILLTNLHWFALILFVVGSITLYAKKQEGDGKFLG